MKVSCFKHLYPLTLQSFLLCKRDGEGQVGDSMQLRVRNKLSSEKGLCLRFDDANNKKNNPNLTPVKQFIVCAF